MTGGGKPGTMHQVEPHPRNGFVEVRVLLRLRETIPIPSGTTFRVVPKLSDPSLPPSVTAGPRVGEVEPLPFSDDWRMSAQHFRLSKFRQHIAVRAVGEETLALAIRIWPSSRDLIQEGEAAGDFGGEGEGLIQYAEMSARWSVTLGCEQCRVAALDRT